LEKGKVVVLEERVPKLKERRRQKANRRLIAYISFFFLFILCVLYFQSPLSNVRHIEVKGNEHLSAGQIIALSGITKRTSFWKVKEDEVKQNLEKHPEVKSVSVEKHFPNTIIIRVSEWRRVAYIYDGQTFFPLLENGYLLKKHTSKTAPSDAPILVNWKKGEDIQEMTGQLAQLSPSVLNAISEIDYTPNKDNRDHVTVYMNDGFEVSASIHNFAEKMSLYPAIVQQLDPNVKGVIHLEVSNYFTPYQLPKKEDDNGKTKK
jgi:cell division protein FtsQ